VQPSSQPTGQRKTAILIVDDEPDVLTIFKKSLELAGHSTYGFVNPSAALEHFRQDPKAYQIIITDVRMPGISGFQLAREVRKINQDVKILLMSSFEISMPEFKRVLPSIKIDGIFDKPVGLDKLNAIVKSVLK
jgi:DNA-binding NtrC family response regulator